MSQFHARRRRHCVRSSRATRSTVFTRQWGEIRRRIRTAEEEQWTIEEDESDKVEEYEEADKEEEAEEDLKEVKEAGKEVIEEKGRRRRRN